MDGQRLQELREDKHLRQADLAKAIGVSLPSIKAYEQGRSSPSDEVKVKIAEFFDVSLDYLLGLIDERVSFRRADEQRQIIVLPGDLPDAAILDIRNFIEFVQFQNRRDKK